MSNILFLSCDKLPLEIFVDCLVDSDLTGLGTGPAVAAVWDRIYTQSLELAQDGSYNEAFEIMKEIDDIRAKITIASSAIDYLQMRFDEEIVLVLNSLALQCTITANDTPQVVVSKLNQVVARMKKWFPKLNRLQSELGKIREGNSGKVTRDYFDGWLDAIGNDAGHYIAASGITVARFYRAKARLQQRINKAELAGKK